MEGEYYNSDSCVVIVDDFSFESEVAKLRGRWELASVLNFLSVFEPLIGRDLRLSAEEIEMGLVKPNRAIAFLHVTLLKGIPPVSKTLYDSDAWVTVLCKKLTEWWPWVAGGEIPLIASKGEEISKYKELDPISRLVMLKALCEIRSDQYDALSYINDGLKQGKEVSCFCKVKIGGNGNGTSYWFDGNTTTGYRLYKAVNCDFVKKEKGKACSTLSVHFDWETLATNLEEFRTIGDELSSSKIATEVSIGKAIETYMIPLVEKLQKKKERALQQKKREEMLLNGFRSSISNRRSARLCRNQRPISYTFDEYDRSIDEAIRITKKRKNEEQSQGKKHMQERNDCNGGSAMDATLKDSSGRKSDSMSGDSESNKLQEELNDEDGEDDDYDGKNENDSYSGNSSDEKNNPNNRNHANFCPQKPKGLRWSKRLAGVTLPAPETSTLTTKNRLRQRPVLNSAINLIVPDSEDEIAENSSGDSDQIEVSES
ncbi:hypothetical protein SLEP1_g1594 [Rubroshorea leprosula]|uniref:DDT domain-containing protein DDR4 n=1 Tax=Rubroshorea leprosula TaxID=152421 RepID=A0AAV5HKZ5_9ROSI|nr:hypothetical protein SLEP1_g1594 [Rubroshorea leprosula]